MRIWVTRTEPGAERLTAQLADQGYAAFKAPVLDIEPAATPPPRSCFDFVLFVSVHAVTQAFANGWTAHRGGGVIAGIGGAAETALRQHGVEPGLAGLASAVDAVAKLQSPPSRTLIVKGEGGRDVVQNWLRARGATVVEWDVYRRVPTTPAVHGQQIDVIVAASGEGLPMIARIWFADRRSAGVPLLVPSARAAEVAAACGFENVVETGGASDRAVLAALAKLQEVNVG